MIGFFPTIYEDELLYSQIARYHQRSGNVRYKFTVDDIYLHRTVKPSIEFVNQYTDDAFSWITKNIDWETIIWKHTMLPAYIRFLSKERKQKALQATLDCSGNINNVIYIPNQGERYLRYCPMCAKEDREKLGETFWHRKHQIAKVNVCPLHRCYLENTEISMSGKSTPNLYDAESIVPENAEARPCLNETEMRLAEYILDVFDFSVDMENNQSVGAYLNSKLSGKYKKNDLVRRITELYEDIKNTFDGMPAMTEPQMQKIYNGSLRDSYYVCQLAFFEGVLPYDLTHLPKEDNSSGIEVLYKKLSQKLNVSYDAVSLIGEEVLKYNYEHNRIHRKTGKLAMNYSAIDDELLPKVETTIEQILNGEGRPERISIAKIEKILNLPQKRIDNLPKCKTFIQSHLETSPQFWAREVCWAVYKIIDEEQILNWVHIRRLTNMKPRDLQKAIPHITDDRIRKIAEEIVAELQI